MILIHELLKIQVGRKAGGDTDFKVRSFSATMSSDSSVIDLYDELEAPVLMLHEKSANSSQKSVSVAELNVTERLRLLKRTSDDVSNAILAYGRWLLHKILTEAETDESVRPIVCHGIDTARQCERQLERQEQPRRHDRRPGERYFHTSITLEEHIATHFTTLYLSLAVDLLRGFCMRRSSPPFMDLARDSIQVQSLPALPQSGNWVGDRACMLGQLFLMMLEGKRPGSLNKCIAHFQAKVARAFPYPKDLVQGQKLAAPIKMVVQVSVVTERCDAKQLMGVCSALVPAILYKMPYWGFLRWHSAYSLVPIQESYSRAVFLCPDNQHEGFCPCDIGWARAEPSVLKGRPGGHNDL